MQPPHKPIDYRVYMLRFWLEGNQSADPAPAWRFSLEDPHTGDRFGFADCEDLYAFLDREISRAGLDGDDSSANM